MRIKNITHKYMLYVGLVVVVGDVFIFFVCRTLEILCWRIGRAAQCNDHDILYFGSSLYLCLCLCLGIAFTKYLRIIIDAIVKVKFYANVELVEQ